MRSKKDRRSSSTAVLNDIQSELKLQERRRLHDRRMENMSMEERQLQFSEMPSIDRPKQK